MNSCILMAEIIQDPQLRYTSETQMAIAEMVVQFPGMRPEDPPATMKVIGWGNLAQEIQTNYHQGDLVVLEGRLSMNTIERPEGFKEKQAEMTVQRLHRLAVDANWDTNSSSTLPAANGAPSTMQKPAATTNAAPATPRSTGAPRAKSPAANFSAPEPMPEPNLDEIPF